MRSVTRVLAALTTAATLFGCASSGSTAAGKSGTGASAATKSPADGPADGGPADGGSPSGTTDLASVLDLVPDASGGYVTYTNWSMLNHQDSTNTPAFAGELTTIDSQLQQAVGIRSTSAQWEIDVIPPESRPLVVVLRYARTSALSALPGKLARYGYHAHGSILTGPRRSSRLWVYGLHNVAIDIRRHLLVDSYNPAAVQSVLSAASHPLGHDAALRPLLALAAARLGGIVSASIAVGPGACVKLANLFGKRLTPAMLGYLRKRFPGTLTAPQAEIVALAKPDSTTAMDALAFPDHRAAEANQAARIAAVKTMDTLDYPDPNHIEVKSSQVTGRLLSLTLSAAQAHAFVARVQDNAIGADICR